MRTALVTGGTVRLGKVIAETLRARGWRVLTVSHRADAGADLVADLSRPFGAPALYSRVLSMLGGEPPDALVNNAALYTGADDAAIMNLNFESPKKLTMLMAGRETGRGAVVNILDSAVLNASAADCAESSYLKSKYELLAFTHKAAAMFADTLNVSAVAPGPVLPPAGFHLKAPPLPGVRPTPEGVAEAVAFLLSANSVTDAVLPVDGGESVARGFAR